jgi:hypothetical protein
MKQSYLKKFLGLFVLVLSSFSCSSDLDFNQVNDLKLEPVVVGNLTYFDVPASDFVASDGSEYNLAFDAQDFDIFRDKYFRSYLQRADFFFEINNTINRAYMLDIILLDANDQPLYTMHFDIPAYSGSENIITKTEIFENAKLNLLKNSKRMGFVISMAPGSALNQNSPGNLILRSSATVYLEIQ